VEDTDVDVDDDRDRELDVEVVFVVIDIELRARSRPPCDEPNCNGGSVLELPTEVGEGETAECPFWEGTTSGY